jgi:hypothetical protein
MAKTLKTILETYAPRSVDEKRFIDKHVVVKHADRNGNGDEVFKASNIKTVKRASEHGYDAGKDSAVYEEVQQIDEIQGIRFGKRQSQLYPHSAEVLQRHGENNGSIHKGLGIGLPSHGYNIEHHRADIERHPRFREAVDVCDEDNPHYSHELKHEIEHPAVQAIARDHGLSSFQAHDYCSRGPFHRRWGHLNFDKYSPTDGPTSPYFDRHPHRQPHEHDMHEEAEVNEAILGRYGPRLGKKESQKYPHQADVLKRYAENNGPGVVGKLRSMGHNFNFENHRPEIENHPHFVRATEVCDDENEHHSLHDQMNHPTVQSIVRDTGHTTFQVHDYARRGSFYRRHGHLDYDKPAPTDGYHSPYNTRARGEEY